MPLHLKKCMTSLSAPITHSSSTVASASRLNFVLAYADKPTREIARQVCAGLVRSLKSQFEVRTSWWSQHLLQRPEIRLSAAKVAAAADMIFCSTHGAEEMPPAIKAWLDLWAPQKNAFERALVVLLTLPTSGAVRADRLRATELYLQDVAHSADMDFFIKVFPLPLRERPSINQPLAQTENQ